VALSVRFWPDTQDHDRNHLIARISRVVLNCGHNLPDDPVPVTAGVDSEAAFPLPLERIPEVRRVLELIEQASSALDLPMSLRVVPLQPAQVVPGFRR
jgi:hypothetical protein